jgi:hypothetical protein
MLKSLRYQWGLESSDAHAARKTNETAIVASVPTVVAPSASSLLGQYHRYLPSSLVAAGAPCIF